MSASAQAMQLRILSGCHEGACVALDPAQDSWTLGHDPHNAIVLRDAPSAQALLHWHDSGWQLACESQTVALPIGQALQWHAVGMVVDGPEAEWLYADATDWPHSEAHTDAEMDQPGSLSAPTQSEAVSDLTQGSEALSAAEHSVHSAPWKHWLGQRLRHKPTRLALVASVGMAAVAAVAAWTQWHDHATVPSAITPVAETHEQTVSREQVQSVVLQLGLADVVQVDHAKGKRHLLRGVVQDQEQLEGLMRSVMGLTRRVLPQVLVQREFEAQVALLQSQMPEGIVLTAGQRADVWLAGPGASPEAFAEAKAVLKRELPEALTVRTGASPKAAQTVHASAGHIPLALLAVQSGPQPYLLLADGHRILPGGQVNEWRLLRIDNDAIILEDAQGQNRRIER